MNEAAEAAVEVVDEAALVAVTEEVEAVAEVDLATVEVEAEDEVVSVVTEEAEAVDEVDSVTVEDEAVRPSSHPLLYVELRLTEYTGGRGRGAPGGRGGKPGLGGRKGPGAVTLEPHKHAGVYIAKGKEHLLVTRNMAPGTSVYGEKRISIATANAEGEEEKVEYRVWNPFRSKLAAGILGGLDDIHVSFTSLTSSSMLTITRSVRAQRCCTSVPLPVLPSRTSRTLSVPRVSSTPSSSLTDLAVTSSAWPKRARTVFQS